MPLPALRFLHRGAALLLLALPLAAAESERLPYRLVAERIATLARLVEWPERRFAQPAAPLIIGVVAPEEVFAELSTVLESHPLKGRPVVMRQLNTRDDVPACHLIFFAQSERDRMEPMLRAARREGILTVGETENFLGRGGVMALVTVRDSLRLQVSAEAAKREKLAVSSRLMQLARPAEIMVGAGGPEPGR